MSKTVTRLPLGGANAGTQRTLTVHRYGPAGARPKAYVQAGLHADEVPGMLVAHHLLRRLDAADAAGTITGEITVVPSANPIGLDQFVNEDLLGRFALGGAGNFNRDYPDLAAAAASRVRGRLTGDAAANVALIRRALVAALAERRPTTETDHLRHALLTLSIDSDIVLDLHCDEQAPMHAYLGTPLWPAAEDLTRQLGCDAVLLADVSGGEPFDEANSAPWWLIRPLVDQDAPSPPPIPPACLAATIELRGQADVADRLADGDADNLFRFLQRRGLIAGDPGPLPPPRCAATPLDGVDLIRAPVSGIVAYRVALGDRIRPGEIIAEIVDPGATDPGVGRTPVHATVEGPVWAIRARRYARAGDVIAKLAGPAPLPGKGKLLLTAR